MACFMALMREVINKCKISGGKYLGKVNFVRFWRRWEDYIEIHHGKWVLKVMTGCWFIIELNWRLL
jgi:hypothetical protein